MFRVSFMNGTRFITIHLPNNAILKFPPTMAFLPTLGTGLFIGSGQALAAGGPLSLLLSYGFISVLVYCMGTAVAEVAAHMPMSGGTMVNHNYRYSSSHLAFSMSYLRWYSLAMLVPFEITNGIVNLGLFVPGSEVAVRVSLMAAVIVGFNMLPEKPFKRSESLFTFLKLLATTGLLILTIVLGIRGVPGTGIRGFHYWNDPGFMKEYMVSGNLGRFLGLVQCLLYSAVSFTLVPELIVQRAEELDTTVRPSILRVAQLDTIQHSVLYVLTVVAIGVLCPSDHPMLTDQGNGPGTSPFLVGIQIHQIQILPIIVSIAIFFSSVASGRSFLFLSSRTLCSLSEAGHAPPMFQRRNRFGVPYVSVIASGLFAGFAYLSMATSSSAVFNWLMHFVTTSGYISWLGSCVVYLHFRRTTEAQGFSRAHQARVQPYGAYFGILSCSVLPFANGLITAQFGVPSNLVAAYLGIASFLLLYFGHRLNSSMGHGAGPEDEEGDRHHRMGHRVGKPLRRLFFWQQRRRVQRTEEIVELGKR